MQLSSQKKKLEETKEKLIKQLEYYKKEDPYLIPGRDSANTVDDDITETEGHDRITANRLKIKEDLIAVDAALERLAKGKYGLCVRCGRAIEGARLEAMPTAQLCLEDERKKR